MNPSPSAAFASNVQPMTPAQAVGEGEQTVTMIFPHDVLLTRDQDHRRILFKAGTQEVPESLVNHIWLKNNGVTKYEGKKIEPVGPPMKLDKGHVDFMKGRGYPATDVEWVQGFYDRMQPEYQKSFLADYAQWSQGKAHDNEPELPFPDAKDQGESTK